MWIVGYVLGGGFELDRIIQRENLEQKEMLDDDIFLGRPDLI